ncbi:hypothetical protein M0R19_03820 [Candidatus Pacearchaeota archaeon]|nr:hypothetical protein [Candidatus Pacearchaeota archaeon]
MNNNKLEYYENLGFVIDITDQYKDLSLKKIKRICDNQYYTNSISLSGFFFKCCDTYCSLDNGHNKLVYSFDFGKIICVNLFVLHSEIFGFDKYEKN